MGRLSSQGWDALLVQKLSVMLHKSFEAPYESKGKGPVMSYEKFVQLLDTEDLVAQKAISILVNDVFSRARGKKQAIDETRQLQHPTYSSVVATTSDSAGAGATGQPFGSGGGGSGSRFARPYRSGIDNDTSAAQGDSERPYTRNSNNVHLLPSLASQRLHGWRVPADYNDMNHYTTQQRRDETAEYDAIIADAQRRVASPLPMPGQQQSRHPQQQDSNQDDPARLFNSIDWPDLNPAASRYEHMFFPSDSDESEDETTAQVRRVERDLAAVATARNRSQSNLTRTSTSDSLSSAATRRRILERLEQRRRDVLERGEQQQSQSQSQAQSQTQEQPRSVMHRYPSLFDTSYSRTTSGRRSPDDTSRQIPVIVGGDFSELPTAVSRSDSDTMRASYGSLQRNNSIRRSGFHASRDQQQRSAPTIAVSDTLLPGTSESPLRSSPGRLQPRSPLSISEPSQNLSIARLTAGVIDLNNMFTRPGATSVSAGAGSRQDAFFDFSRLNRQADRATREQSGGREDQGSEEDLPRAESARNRFLFSASTDPMLGSASPHDGDALSELLGSSSTVAGLGGMATEDRLSRSPLSVPVDRRNIIPPRAPILSRRSFPFDAPQSTSQGAGGSGSQSRPVPARQQTTSAAETTTSEPTLQRSNSFPDGRGPLYRREEILSLAQFLNEDSIRAVEEGL